MRLTLIVGLALISTAFAQRNLNPIGNNGNVLRPGIPLRGGPAAVSGGFTGPAAISGGFTGPAAVSGGFTGGFTGGGRTGGYARGGRIGGGRSFGGGAVIVPYGYGGGYGFDGFYPGGYRSVYNPAPGTYDPIFGGYNPGPMLPEPVQPTPTVVINQNFQTDTVRPQFRDYSNVPLPEPGPAAPEPSAGPALADDQPTIFLIAMRDHTIYPVIAYWVQGDTLNYIGLKGDQNRVSVALVDRDLSKQLNAERNVPFALPAAGK